MTFLTARGKGDGLGLGDVRNEVWVKSLVDGSEAPVIADDYSRWFPRWSPDGMRLAYERRNLKTNERQLMAVVQRKSRRRTTGNAEQHSNWSRFDWSPDGKWLLTANEGGIWLVPSAAAPHAETAAQKITFRFGVPALPATLFS